jgi:N-acetylglucosaminyldiphosphoundecaprenol N-acetyl-beta-D-mannosaminyltransferase
MVEALEIIERLVRVKSGGFVVTPNLDHVVIAEHNLQFRAAYYDASLAIVDGMPLVWASKILGFPLPEKISGSDIITPLMKRAAECGMRVYLLGAAPGVGLEAAKIFTKEMPELNIVGIDSPILGLDVDKSQEAAALERMTALEPDLVLVALGAPKQELLMQRWHEKGVLSVMVGIGAGLDFIAGKRKRAPIWMSNAGLEWFYRLCCEPRRLAKRYLVRDMGFLRVMYRMLNTPSEERFFYS